MKKYLYLLVILILLPSCLPSCIKEKNKLPECGMSDCSQASKEQCRCYCSVQCGPRTIKDSDSPTYTYAKDDTEHKYGQRCFCAQRDIDLYVTNRCYEEKQ